jgi:hypothetical protein
MANPTIDTNILHDKQKLTIAIILCIFFILIAIVTMNYLQGKNPIGQPTAIPTPIQQQPSTITKTVEKTAALQLVPQGNNSINVVVNAGKGTISGVQLQLSYDPRVLTNVSIQRGSFFTKPLELQNSIDSTNGMINYAIAISPSMSPQPGTGIVATIYYTPNLGLMSKTTINPLPGTKVTAEGIDQSVLQTPAPLDINVAQ